MFCPTCQTAMWTAAERCPTCGDSLRAVTAEDAVEVVETTAEMGAVQSETSAGASTDATALTITAPATLPLPVRLAELSVAAWRQPAVRVAVKTGASALAVSLAMRAARRALAYTSSRHLSTRSALPTLSDLLPREPVDGRDRGAVVIETFVYMRRVVRR